LDAEDDGVHTGRIVPVYRKLAGMRSRTIRTIVHRIVSDLDPSDIHEPLPPDLLARWSLPGKHEAISSLHFPASTEDCPSSERGTPPWLRRLALEEMYLLQLALSVRRAKRSAAVRRSRDREADRRLDALARELLPFAPTSDQRRVLAEIASDLAGTRPMGRLLQGDVGSGKTAVAMVAMQRIVERGAQAALLAPTAILAEQHHRRLDALLTRAGLSPGTTRLTGASRGAERARTLEAIASGAASHVIGTHALLDDAVRFRALDLVVIDEQHRFGVAQRVSLVAKSSMPHVLVMTATPIPRSLAMTLYGDLDVSVIRELPPGRRGVRTVIRPVSARAKVYDGIRREIARGHQAIVVVPRIEDVGDEARSAVRLARSLGAGRFADARVGVVHGRLAEREKHATMREFEHGTIDLLVATTVIEVGIDVPNATVLVVEQADHYGLAQLHQMRGRVGRGTSPGYCVLLVDRDEASRAALERLGVLEKTADGFEVAERDLEMRGPGAAFSTRQHGADELHFLSVALREPELIAAAREGARRAHDTTARLSDARSSIPPSWRRRLHLPDAG
jgi:ATP-dependent DNA helicase RecG